MDLYDLFFSGYNPINTIVYGFSLGVLGLFSVKVLRKMKFRISRYTYLSITPFILSAVTVRVLIDAEIFPFLIFLVGIFGVISFGVLWLISLAVSLLIQKRTGVEYYKSTFLIGAVLTLPNLFFIRVVNQGVVTFVLVYTLPLLILLSLIKIVEKERVSFFSKNFFPLSSNTFASVVNFVGFYYFGYGQKHVIQKLWHSLVRNPLLILAMNILFVVPILYALEYFEEDVKKFGRLLIFALTFGSGLRNFLRILMLV